MALADDFKKAQDDVKALTKDPGNDAKLELYGLYKQATDGDVSGKKPGMFDMVGKAKYEAWEKQKGKSKDAAMTAYIAKVAALKG